jgi:hypothetical protein
MEIKKFVNLSLNYKNFIIKCNDILSGLNIQFETSNFEILNNIYSLIETELTNYDLQISDINHLLENYNKDNEYIEQLKKLVYYRNFYLIKKLLRQETTIWKDFILKLKTKCVLKTDNQNIKTKNIEKIFLNLLEKYIGTWNSLNNYIIINNNKIKNIEIIDPDDYNNIFKTLKNI